MKNSKTDGLSNHEEEEVNKIKQMKKLENTEIKMYCVTFVTALLSVTCMELFFKMCGKVKFGMFFPHKWTAITALKVSYLGVFCFWDFRIRDAQPVGHVLIATGQYQNSSLICLLPNHEVHNSFESKQIATQ